MKTRSISLWVSDTIGNVSGEYFIPEKSTCIITLAHGAGAGMQLRIKLLKQPSRMHTKHFHRCLFLFQENLLAEE